MSDSAARVFTVPASVPFLPALIAALLEGRLVPGFRFRDDPFALAGATIYLPTRRACRLARDVFLDVTGTQAAILPRIVAVGDIDDDEIAFAESALGPLADEALALAPAMEAMERRLLLSTLVREWAKRIASDGGTPPIVAAPASALALADELARLFDDMTTRNVDWSRLDGLVPDDLDQYWRLTHDFLKIAHRHWPEILAERGRIEPAARRDRLIALEAERLARSGGGPVIAAGSTASMPSTAKLLAAIARLPNGAVVLPGLDTNLDEETWSLVADDESPLPGHPQYGMAGFLKSLGIARSDVETLLPPAAHGREILLSEALRPAAATERWRARLSDAPFAAHAQAALGSIVAIEAAHSEDEALAIAIALREAVDDGGPASRSHTAALITPDRGLARRVLAALDRWKVPVDDSGGDPLHDTPAGVFARLVAETALGGFASVPLLALLKHPLCSPHAHAATLERALLRGARPAAGIGALARALQALSGEFDDLHRSDPRRTLARADLQQAGALIERLAVALAPLERYASGTAPLHAIAQAHRNAIARLSGDAPEPGAAFLGADGLLLAQVFDEIDGSGTAKACLLAGYEYADFFRQLMAARMVRRPGAPGARVRIYGPLEARLQVADRMVLGGLVEGIWPPETRNDPWLSRPMRKELGLDLPERRIGLSAHDFAQALGAREIVVARAAKVDGTPTVPSRFLQRLAAIAGEERWNAAVARGAKYLQWAHALDRPADVEPVPAPAPRPPLATRPKALSVTEIEHWLRDPYTIYARHILKLTRLDPVGLAAGAAERGSAIHGAIGDFSQAHAGDLPADAFERLLAFGRRRFAPFEDDPQVRAFWWPRFQQIARWFVAWERERRADIDTIVAERRGGLSFQAGATQFRLTGIADRLERRSDGRYSIVDFKTGAVPTGKQVRAGIAPQLTLEAAILRGGGFEGIPAGASVGELVYVKLKGGDAGGEADAVDLKDMSADAAAEHALAKLKLLVARFDDPAEPYRSLVMPMWKNRYGTYDDLARVKEWSASGGLVEGDDT